MNKLLITGCLLATAIAAVAMPTKKELAAAQKRVKDVPPELITELVDKEFNRDMGLKAPKEIEEAEKNLQQVAKNQSVA